MDGVTPYDDVRTIARVLVEIAEAQQKIDGLRAQYIAACSRLHRILPESCLVQARSSGPVIRFERYTDVLLASIATIIPSIDLPNAYPGSPSHSVNPDVPIVSLAGLDATEAA